MISETPLKRCPKCEGHKSLENFGKNVRAKDKLTCWCKACLKTESKKSREKHKKSNSERAKKYEKENADKIALRKKGYYARNKERINLKNREYHHANKESAAKYARVYRQEHKAAIAMRSARLRANKKLATPAWANEAAIKGFYDTSQGLSMLLGEWYHVDHIVPLNSEFVCGLHCEANLQVLPWISNVVKSNKWWPDMWEHWEDKIE